MHPTRPNTTHFQSCPPHLPTASPFPTPNTALPHPALTNTTHIHTPPLNHHAMPNTSPSIYRSPCHALDRAIVRVAALCPVTPPTLQLMSALPCPTPCRPIPYQIFSTVPRPAAHKIRPILPCHALPCKPSNAPPRHHPFMLRPNHPLRHALARLPDIASLSRRDTRRLTTPRLLRQSVVVSFGFLPQDEQTPPMSLDIFISLSQCLSLSLGFSRSLSLSHSLEHSLSIYVAPSACL